MPLAAGKKAQHRAKVGKIMKPDDEAFAVAHALSVREIVWPKLTPKYISDSILLENPESDFPRTDKRLKDPKGIFPSIDKQLKKPKGAFPRTDHRLEQLVKLSLPLYVLEFITPRDAHGLMTRDANANQVDDILAAYIYYGTALVVRQLFKLAVEPFTRMVQLSALNDQTVEVEYMLRTPSQTQHLTFWSNRKRLIESTVTDEASRQCLTLLSQKLSKETSMRHEASDIKLRSLNLEWHTPAVELLYCYILSFLHGLLNPGAGGVDAKDLAPSLSEQKAFMVSLLSTEDR